MTTRAALLAEIASLVNGSFAGRQAFACLAGSTAAGTATTDSDLDLLVVLPEDLPPVEAITSCERFTRAYVDLHRRRRRPPDLRWPGEVLYERDLHVGVAGGAFTVDGPTRRLRLCPGEEPYRYWVSMTATAVPVTGDIAFAVAADRCAEAIAHHVLTNAADQGTLPHTASDLVEHPAWREWRIGAGHLAGPGILAARITATIVQVERDGAGFLTRWRAGLRAPTAPPELNTHRQTWRRLARDADR